MSTHDARPAALAAFCAAILAAAMAVSLSACSDTLGIFASVAAETDNSGDKTAAIELSSPTFVERLGTAYFAGIGRIWTKADGATQWTHASVAGISGLAEGSIPFAGSAAVADAGGQDALFAAVSDSASGAGLGVWATSDGANWTRTDSSFPPTGENLSRLLSANGVLFAVTEAARDSTDDDAAYSIYYLSGSAFAATNVLGDTTIGMPSSAAWDGTAYWFAAGDKILRGGIGALAALAGPSSGAGSYSGLAASGAAVLATTKTGYLHRSGDGGSTWVSAGPFADSDGDAYSLSEPSFVDFGSTASLVVGTDSKARSSSDTPPSDGYLEFDLSAGFSSSLQPDANHAIIATSVDFDSSLTTRSVKAMPLFAPGDGTLRLFALTDAYGLWSKTWDGSAWGNWRRE